MKHICSSTAHVQLLVLKEVKYAIHALENMVYMGVDTLMENWMHAKCCKCHKTQRRPYVKPFGAHISN